MLNLEDFMNLRDLKQQGWSVSAIADELSLDRKTVRKHLLDAPQAYKRENPAPCKIDPYRPFLRERWETGVHNARKLLDELRLRGYDGGYSQLKLAVTPWREEGRERAFVRFETAPGEQSQMDWGHFGNWGGRRLYGFALTLCYSRMRYIEFTQSQDIHHLLSSMVHGFRYFGGVTESVLTDRMKTVLLDQKGSELHFNQKFLQFAAYYGFVPRVCRPYRPETKAYAMESANSLRGRVSKVERAGLRRPAPRPTIPTMCEKLEELNNALAEARKCRDKAQKPGTGLIVRHK